MRLDARIYVAGHTGMVGSAIVRHLKREGYVNLITATRAELDLRRQVGGERLFADAKPEYVFIAAATVGGIHANRSLGAQFITDNLQITTNLITASHNAGVKKLLFLGSSCAYPKWTVPLEESFLLGGPPEPTNRPYAVAKIAGIEMCDAYRAQYGCSYISLMPCNLYGPGDNFSLMDSHVIPAMIRKFEVARESNLSSVTLWGDGNPIREVMHVDDLASACLLAMRSFDEPGPLNVGTGTGYSIRQLADMVARACDYHGAILWDHSMPNGSPSKTMAIGRAFRIGWCPRISIADGLASTAAWYREHRSEFA